MENYINKELNLDLKSICCPNCKKMAFKTSPVHFIEVKCSKCNKMYTVYYENNSLKVEIKY